MNEETTTPLDGELTRVIDPDFARLADNYGEDDPIPVRHKAATPRISMQLDLLARYREAINPKSDMIGRRPAEPEEVEALLQELKQMGVRWVDGVPHLG